MIVADTTVWIDYGKNRSTSQTAILKAHIEANDVL
jgi:hypothetical protein